MSKRIGWIGLGKMGAPMASLLCKTNAQVSVYNRSPEKCGPVVEAGASLAPNASVLAAQSDILFTMLSDDKALRAVLLGDAGALKQMRAGSTLVDMSTVSAGVSNAIAELAREQGVHYLRAPVSGSVAMAEAGTLTVLASGDKAAFDASLAALETMSAKQFYVGNGEQARILKLSINMMVGFSAAMMGEALALGLKNGLDRADMLEVIGSSAVASPLIGYKLDALSAQNYAPAFEVVQMAKDYDLILGAGRDSGVPMPLAAQVREGWSELISAGEGDADFFKYVALAEKRAGLPDISENEAAA